MTTRTDVPLVPVPFADRTASPLWASLTPRETPRLKECAGCGQARHLGAYRADAATFDGLSHECRRCHNRKRRAAA